LTNITVEAKMPASSNCRAEEVEIVVDQAEPSEDHDVRLGLDADPGQQAVVGFARDREDRDLLALHERIEDIDHGTCRSGSGSEVGRASWD
jgi:hypothetical protein